MGFFDTLKEVITNKPSNLSEPNFIKEFNEDNKQLKDLQELLTITPDEARSEIEQDIKLLSYGLIGEKNIAYELKHSHMPILILHDLYLEYNGLTAQIDYVVIDQRFILVIECKNMVGDIEITSNGDFIRYFKSRNGKVYKKEGMYSPIVQNERHVEIIRDILKAEKFFSKDDYGMVQHVVTVANPKSVINSKYAKEELRDHIIKHDQLINKMKQLHESNKNGRWFPEESMYKLADSLMKYNGIYTVDYEKKYGISIISDKKENKIGDCNSKEKNNYTEENIEVNNKEIIEEIDSMEESSLYKELKEYRLNKSREEKVKPYFLYNNLQLEAIVKAKPQTLEELKEINGFGNVKCEKYGEDIIDIIRRSL
ncbi:HRDC domain-containing protein [Clostridium sp.]|uniref:HRDC domain-containing protein n=1 Tax=Clostridium sp. TaxID=1506 RepID=UPI002850C958|nr:HRDC domain-containing protein [Clostridium sp.]MDR3597702.1 NERD domain-containing protein [Clostridium sp.]